ncbi:MAG: DUF6677 family protein [Candidatus Acidiferrales bacterium]
MDERTDSREAQPVQPAAPLHPDAASIHVDPRGTPAPTLAWLAAAAAWFVPGLGHLLLRRWGRAAIIFLCVAGMAIVGYQLQGQVFSMGSGDIFGILGHLADVGTGAFYFFSRFLEPAGANTAVATGDIGTRLLAIAGLLNFLCVADALEIARRAKP